MVVAQIIEQVLQQPNIMGETAPISPRCAYIYYMGDFLKPET